MFHFKSVHPDGGIDPLFNNVCRQLIQAPQVDTGHWQGKKGTPMSQTRELASVVVEIPIAATPGAWASWMKPNLPWAEDHFMERVSGIPHNPPPSHEYWPFNQEGNKDHMDGGKFSHSYPERLWCRWGNGGASAGDAQVAHRGIRYPYGDLDHAVDLLVHEPHTRQCYVPLWFPEDLYAAAIEHQRVPCTLGYHMILRSNKLNIFYPMRSLDWLRYFQDDAYMAGRLTHWFIEQCRKASDDHSIWQEVEPGKLTMHVVSCHCFEGDIPIIKQKLKKKEPVRA